MTEPTEQQKDFIAANVKCAKLHYRPVSDSDKPCPECGSLVPFKILPREVPHA